MKKAQVKQPSSKNGSRSESRKGSVQELDKGQEVVVGAGETGASRRNKYVPDMTKIKNSCKRLCQNLCYIVFAVITIALALAVIIVAILSSVANKIYDAEQSGHMVAMVILAVTAAVTLSAVIHSIIAICKEHTKPLYATAFVLVILAIIQALIAGIAVSVTEEDELKIGQALSNSFKLAREGNMRHMKLWGSTQHELECCGIYGPEDYRHPDVPQFFPPTVPVSCCPAYDASRPDSTQEREKELCRAQRQFWVSGCKVPVIEVFRESAVAVIVATAILIVFELLTGVIAGILSKRSKMKRFFTKSDGTAETTVDNP